MRLSARGKAGSTDKVTGHLTGLLPEEQARKLRAELDVGSPITRVCQHAGSALIAAAADDLVIRMCAP